MTLNNKLYLLHQYHQFLYSLLKENSHNYFLNKVVESILEDFHIEDYIENKWSDKLLSEELYAKLKMVFQQIISIYDMLKKQVGSYDINYHDFFNHPQMPNILMDISRIEKDMGIELAESYNFDVYTGRYLDGSTYDDHKLDEAGVNIPSINLKKSGSLIKDLVDSVKKNQGTKNKL